MSCTRRGPSSFGDTGKFEYNAHTIISVGILAERCCSAAGVAEHAGKGGLHLIVPMGAGRT